MKIRKVAANTFQIKTKSLHCVFSVVLERLNMRFTLALLVTLFLTGCRWECDTLCDPSERMLPVAFDDEMMVYQKEFCRVINEFATELEWYYQIWLEHSYAKQDDDGSFIVWVDFTTQDIEDLPGARRLSVRMIDSLLDRLNGSQILRSGQGRDFTFEDLYFSIEYTSFYGRYNDPLIVGRSELKHGYMNVFYAHDAFKVDPIIYHKHSEPYETSRCIVAAQDAARKRLRPTKERIYDRIVAPEDWMSGDPDYLRRPENIFDAYEFDFKSTLSNFPSYERVLPSGETVPVDNGGRRSTRERPSPPPPGGLNL